MSKFKNKKALALSVGAIMAGVSVIGVVAACAPTKAKPNKPSQGTQNPSQSGGTQSTNPGSGSTTTPTGQGSGTGGTTNSSGGSTNTTPGASNPESGTKQEDPNPSNPGSSTQKDPKGTDQTNQTQPENPNNPGGDTNPKSDGKGEEDKPNVGSSTSPNPEKKTDGDTVTPGNTKTPGSTEATPEDSDKKTQQGSEAEKQTDGSKEQSDQPKTEESTPPSSDGKTSETGEAKKDETVDKETPPSTPENPNESSPGSSTQKDSKGTDQTQPENPNNSGVGTDSKQDGKNTENKPNLGSGASPEVEKKTDGKTTTPGNTDTPGSTDAAPKDSDKKDQDGSSAGKNEGTDQKQKNDQEFNAKKDTAKSTINALKNLSNDEKKKFTDKIDLIKDPSNQDSIQTIVDEANTLDAENLAIKNKLTIKSFTKNGAYLKLTITTSDETYNKIKDNSFILEFKNNKNEYVTDNTGTWEEHGTKKTLYNLNKGSQNGITTFEIETISPAANFGSGKIKVVSIKSSNDKNTNILNKESSELDLG